MYAYRTPGVRFEWLDPTRPAVQPLRTDVAGFVGVAQRGPRDQPRRVESWTQFRSTFGGHIPQAFLAYAVEGFFANGGQTCWVVRVAGEGTAAASIDLVASQWRPVFRLDAANEGTWAHDLVVSVIRTGRGRFSLALRLPDGTQELWRALATDPADPHYMVAILNDRFTGSLLVHATDLRPEAGAGNDPGAVPPADLLSSVGHLSGGADGLTTLRADHLSGSAGPPDRPRGLAALERVDEVSIVAMPDIMPKPRLATSYKPKRPRCDHLEEGCGCASFSSEVVQEIGPAFDDAEIAELQSELVAHCERLRDRVAILDVPPSAPTPDDVRGWRRNFDTKFAAAYFPWIRILDPLRVEGLAREVPPSGHVAGIYARGDLAVGVHKPPANEVIEGAADVGAGDIDDVRHGDLNELGVNVLRAEAGRGVRVAGARTLSSEREWRYVNVRRLVCMIEEALDEQLQWAVFEPGDQALWRDMDRVARTFLLGLWQRGMLDGATAAEAFSVTCDESTNPPEDRDLGRVTCLMGLQPPWPAEFVVVRIGKTDSRTEFVELSGGDRA